FLGFMLFNFMNNLGPNAQTYLISGEVFPVKIRAKGAGFAASIAKLGAILTAFMFPILLHVIGVFSLLLTLVVTSLLGAWVTHKYRFETSGKNIENL
ncbi:MFS transporter, partial [Photobacterium damselae]